MTTPPPSPPNFRLPAQPTILVKEPSDETVTRLRQLAPFYWSHPQTTNCAIHFPIDVKHQSRIQAYNSRVRQQRIKVAQAAGLEVPPTSPRRASWAQQAPHSTTPPNKSGRKSTSPRLRSSSSASTTLSSSKARESIIGSAPRADSPPSERRGSFTPGYDPFNHVGTSIVAQPTETGFANFARRESAPIGARMPPPPLNHVPLPTQAPDAHRRGSAPSIATKGMPMRTVRLHVEFLSAQSALIRQVLTKAAGFPSVDAAAKCINQPSPTHHHIGGHVTPPSPTSSLGEQHVSMPLGNAGIPPSLPTPPPEPTAGLSQEPENLFPHSFFRFAPQRYPRVLPPQTHNAPGASGPTIILPVPDPASFPLLIHYMYFGRLDNIERTLRDGQVTWEGLVKNVEYLGLRDDLKRYLGNWWKRWRDGRRGAGDEVEQENVRPWEEEEDDLEDRRRYTYRDMKLEMDDDMDSDMSEWHHPSLRSHPSGADELTGLLDRF